MSLQDFHHEALFRYSRELWTFGDSRTLWECRVWMLAIETLIQFSEGIEDSVARAWFDEQALAALACASWEQALSKYDEYAEDAQAFVDAGNPQVSIEAIDAQWERDLPVWEAAV